MKRRQVLKSSATVLAAFAASPVLSGAPLMPPNRKEAFATALRAKPWLSGFAHIDRQRFDATATISGRWPQGLSGTLYRNGLPRMNWVIFATRIGLTATVYFMRTAWVLTVFRIRRDMLRRISVRLSARQTVRCTALSIL